MTPQDLVLRSVRSVVAMLAPLDESDWERNVENVGWSCRFTIEHIGGDFLHYAGQVAQQATDHYVAFSFDQSRSKTHAELVETVDMAGRLLAAAVSWAPSTSLGWHPQGMFAPAGFAAMGACEALVHGHDIAASLDVRWEPDEELCRVLVGTVFPGVTDGLDTYRPWDVLLWATGRQSLTGSDDVVSWDYRALSTG